MLKKLIKYEWRETWKMGLIILLAIAGITLVGTLGVVLPVNYIQSRNLGNTTGTMSAGFMSLMLTMSAMLYVVTFVGVNYGMLIYQGLRFYKTMYSEEGYLTHTLPVTPKQLLFSKTFVAGIWYLLVGLGIILSIGILIGTLFGSLMNTGAMRDLSQILREMERTMELDESYLFSLIHGIIYMIAVVIIKPFSKMMILFGCLTVGQLSKKYKAFMGILVYIGVWFANSIVNSTVKYIFTALSDKAYMANNQAMSNFLMVFGSSDMTLLILLGLAVGFYYLSCFLLNKKLNLE